MMLYVRCSYVNATENHMIGEDSEPQRAFTDDRGALFRDCQREYGRCVSKMYRDKSDGGADEVGWVFQGKDRYTDTKRTYIREVWVEVIDRHQTTAMSNEAH